MPTEEEIDMATDWVSSGPPSDAKLFGYNNIIFLQKSKKSNLKLQNKFKYDGEEDWEEIAKTIEFPKEGERIIFNMYDAHKNSSIYI